MGLRPTLTAMASATAVLPTDRLLSFYGGNGDQPVMPCPSGPAVVVLMELLI
jgi:hypothetical protein